MGNMIRSCRRSMMNSTNSVTEWETGETYSSDHHIMTIDEDIEAQLALNNPIRHPSPSSPPAPAYRPAHQLPALQPYTYPRIADNFEEAVEAPAVAGLDSINIDQNEWEGVRAYNGGSSFNEHNFPMHEAESPTRNSNYEHLLLCHICLDKPKDMAFGCGHLTCRECGLQLHHCPICRAVIDTRVNLYL